MPAQADRFGISARQHLDDVVYTEGEIALLLDAMDAEREREEYIEFARGESLGILMTNALAAADELFTPIQCEYFALEGLVKIVRVIEQVRDSGANALL